MKKFILFALLVCLTAIGNHSFAAKMHSLSKDLKQTVVIKINSQNIDKIDELIKLEVAKKASNKPFEITCYLVSIEIERIGNTIFVSLFYDCFEKKPIPENMC